MITRLEVDGFKSLRDFAADLEPFTVLIGPNSAGKSNVIEALSLLSRLATKPIAEAFKQGRGKSIDQFARHGAEAARSIRFAVEFLEYGRYPPWPAADGTAKDLFQSRYRYELTVERHTLPSGAEKLVVTDEHLRAMRREEDTWLPVRPEFSAYAGYANAGEDYLRGQQHRSILARMRSRAPSLQLIGERDVDLTRTALSAGIGTPATALMLQNLKQCRVIDPGTAIMAGPSERIDSGELAPDASNLPTILANLPPPVVGAIRADLVSLVPGIASFDVKPTADEIRLDFELSGGERMPARLVSAGTLRILALLTALRMEPRPFVLCIEEPENGIYPARLRALLDLLREAADRTYSEEAHEALEDMEEDLEGEFFGGDLEEGFFGGDLEGGFPGGDLSLEVNQLPTQILLTTHSPVALAALRSRPQHLRFVDMVRRDRERVTRVRTVAPPGAGDRGRTTLSLREIDALLQAARGDESA